MQTTPMTDHDRSIQRLMRIATSCSRPSAAAKQFASIAEKAESYYGPDHEETLNIRDFWARSLYDAEDHTAAIACNEENLRRRLRSKSFGKNHGRTREIRRLLALSYEASNQQEKAVEQYRELINREEEQNDHTDLFDYVCEVSALLVEWGKETGNRDKYTEANKIATKYLEMAQKELPQDHETLLYLTYHVGYQLGLLEKHAEASKQFKDVIRKIEATETPEKNKELLEKCRTQYSYCLQRLEKKETNNERNPVTDRHGVIKPPRLRVSKPKNTHDSPQSKASEVKENDQASTSTQSSKSRTSKHTRISKPPDGPKTSSSRIQSESSKISPHIRTNSRQGHTRSKSESTVDKDVSDHKSKAETTTHIKRSPLVVPKLLEPAKTIKRIRSASATSSRLSAEPLPRPATASPSLKPVGENVPQDSGKSSSTTSSRRPAEPLPRPATAAPILRPVEETLPKSEKSSLNTVQPENAGKSKTLGVIKAEKRSSSTGPVASRSATRARRGEQFFESNTQDESERWFTHLQQNSHRFLEKYHRSGKRVRIALLDTGVALRNPSAVEMSEEIKMDLCDQVVRGKRLRNQLPPDKDMDGHGSECAYLLTRVSPFAQILSYRIVETGIHDIDPEIVEEALRHAIDRQVDIISMSFGCAPSTNIRSLLNEAKGKGILMFAATSNDGGSIKFPAYCDEVFGIDAANRTGGLFPENPAATQLKPQRFTALGEILSLRGSISGSAQRPELKKGTSFATPIAAATAAMILEFANQPPLAYDPMAIKGLRMQEGMRAVLLKEFSSTKSAHADFHHINIEHFKPMNDKKDWSEGGNCHDFRSDRYKAAEKICEVLNTALDMDVGKLMKEKIFEQWREQDEAERKKKEAERKKKTEATVKALKNVMEMLQDHETESA
ncbi:hypothetical protein HDK90DRAFT_127239 [Phyllosticta capitalensis]|uniref:Peptidase S8/S53 domain-containing protein n=1 Tax=Phyllosticta capitalensis TaxID=121624 RepID=A0ABR1YY17_9PEZI